MPFLTDEEAAQLAICTFAPGRPPSPAQTSAAAVVAAQLASPAPFIEDLHTLFAAFDTLYFRAQLHATTTLAWSARMTSCAGTCSLKTGAVAVRLSEALLKFRPRGDTVNTLLHEMVHAYLFVAGGRHVRGDDPTGHGAGFQMLAAEINQHGGYGITTTHTFHDEVRNYQTHVWACSGPCRDRPPYFGLVHRAMNRPPGPSDPWHLKHQETCGGVWIKISEPPAKEKKGRASKDETVQRNKIDSWIVKARARESDDDYLILSSGKRRILNESELSAAEGSA